MKKKWLDLAEYASLLGLGVGSVASVVSSQFLYATAPLSVLALLNLANRRRLDSEVEGRTAIAINAVDQKVSKHVELLNQQIQALPTPEILAGLKKSLLIKDREILTKLSGEIAALHQELQDKLAPLEQMELGTLKQDLSQAKSHYTQLNDAVAQMKKRLGQLSGSEQGADWERAIAHLEAELSQLRGQVQKLSDQTRPVLMGLQDQLNHVNQQLRKLPAPFDASTLQQQVTEMVRMVSELVPKRDWGAVLLEIQALQQQQESLAVASGNLHRQVQDLHQQIQARPTKATLVGLQNQMAHLNQQLQELPPPFDPAVLKQKLAELVKTVADLVPRQDFSGLVAQVKALQQQQSSQSQAENQLRRELQALQQHLQRAAAAVTEVSAAPAVERAIAFPPPDHPAEDSDEAPPVPAPAHRLPIDADFSPFLPVATIEGYNPSGPGQWQQYLATQLQAVLSQLSQRLQTLPVEQEFQPQVEAAFRYELQSINHQWHTAGQENLYELIFDGAAAYASKPQKQPDRGGVFTGPDILEAALETTTYRLVLVLPWSAYHHLNEELISRLEQLLQNGCQVDLGWCHIVEPTLPRFLTPISQRWHLQSFQQGRLQETLRRLLTLKRTYPEALQFKILGVRESFLVVDDQLAVVGMNSTLPELAIFPELGMKLQTTDPEVVEQLLRWYESPALEATDTVSHWNRAATYYDLSDRPAALADLERILSVNPDDALALNFRGVVRYDLGDRQGALADFTQSLELNPRLMIAYCNRGFVHSELGDQLDAIADFNAALRLHPNFALVYFYRGVACQKFGELSVAIANYDEAIRLAPNAAPAFYYRGMAYAWTKEPTKAIADLERAAHLFDGEGSTTNADKARAQLEKLWQAVGNQNGQSSENSSGLASAAR